MSLLAYAYAGLRAGTFSAPAGFVPIESRPDLFWLDRDMAYRRRDGILIVAPKGFITDDASIPKALDWIPALDRQGRSRLPGGIHDALYTLGREKGKAFADDTLREMCEAAGLSRFWSGVIYQGVHLGGASAWNGDARRAAEIHQEGSFISEADYLAWKARGGTVFPV